MKKLKHEGELFKAALAAGGGLVCIAAVEAAYRAAQAPAGVAV